MDRFALDVLFLHIQNEFMFDFSNARIQEVFIHLINHDDNDQNDVVLSEEAIDLSHPELSHVLESYIFRPFERYEGYSRFKNLVAEDNESNPMSVFSKQFFNRDDNLQDSSKRIAYHLAQKSTHHGIKSGELLIVRISDVMYDDELVEALAVVKSETKNNYLKFLYNDHSFEAIADAGVDILKIDKGAIVYNVNADDGFIVASIDRTNQGVSAQFWNNDFLNIEPLKEEYIQTEQFMNMAQTYLRHQIHEDTGLPKGDQLNILHDAGEYFKKNNSFNQNDFEREVLGESPELVESFNEYKDQYAQELQVNLPSDFAISNLAVKRSAKDFKSVLKLDKNFHVYIHGDRKMIEHGVSPDGRKFYKLYYDQES